ncbi:hypothetical protein M0813_19162 [Anaeramoeba flamelloides]|uniref:Uncharacterized protein n=1 Tax=Anaeramoeba flamelloides TaxID=1746091 RepID=A0ABQ8YPI0_9EUKA|nr:hypothetical protein M0813_19162 [Anaeramoeba flamelloides]
MKLNKKNDKNKFTNNKQLAKKGNSKVSKQTKRNNNRGGSNVNVNANKNINTNANNKQHDKKSNSKVIKQTNRNNSNSNSNKQKQEVTNNNKHKHKQEVTHKEMNKTKQSLDLKKIIFPNLTAENSKKEQIFFQKEKTNIISNKNEKSQSFSPKFQLSHSLSLNDFPTNNTFLKTTNNLRNKPIPNQPLTLQPNIPKTSSLPKSGLNIFQSLKKPSFFYRDPVTIPTLQKEYKVQEKEKQPQPQQKKQPKQKKKLNKNYLDSFFQTRTKPSKNLQFLKQSGGNGYESRDYDYDHDHDSETSLNNNPDQNFPKFSSIPTPSFTSKFNSSSNPNSLKSVTSRNTKNVNTDFKLENHFANIFNKNPKAQKKINPILKEFSSSLGLDEIPQKRFSNPIFSLQKNHFASKPSSNIWEAKKDNDSYLNNYGSILLSKDKFFSKK